MQRRVSIRTAGRGLALWALVALSAAGCSNSSTNTPTTPTAPILTETFSASVNPNGAHTDFFLVLAAGDITATITELSGDNTVVGLELGTSADGINCQQVISNDSARKGSAMLGRASGGPAAFCARVYDTGSLTETVQYTLEVTHP